MSDFKYQDRCRPYLNFIKKYSEASNAATGSQVDSNANVDVKNMTTMAGQLYKKEGIAINRLAMQEKITEMYGEELAKQYVQDLQSHLIYRHDETAVVGTPYCASITLYPFLLNGLKSIGGSSGAPKNIDSFCGGFINLVFAVSSQLAGACSTPEFLSYLNYFIEKEYGEDYYLRADQVVDLSSRKRTIDRIICDYFKQVVYSLNQPAAARGYQSVFWNIAYFDQPYFNGMFDDFVFPDGTPMHWNGVNWLQKRFMKWFNEERLKTIITFPVETVNLLNDGKDYVDKEWADFVAEMWSEGHSFFLYTSDSVDALASCCRLKNEIQQNQFSYTLGAGGISTGSKCVMTININRLIQTSGKLSLEEISDAVYELVERMHNYLKAFNSILKQRQRHKLIQIYDAGFVNPDKCYLTIGINGCNEAAQFLGLECKADNEGYQLFCNTILQTISQLNKKDREPGIIFNTEYVPAENLGVKNAKWDKRDGLFSPRKCYNSYFYLPEDQKCSIIDKFKLHGSKFTRNLDGGVALHANLDQHLTKDQYRFLMNVAVKEGCQYFTFNVPNTICNDCKHISKHRYSKCQKCGSYNIDYATRVIGYLKRVSAFSEQRQKEASERYYHKDV